MAQTIATRNGCPSFLNALHIETYAIGGFEAFFDELCDFAGILRIASEDKSKKEKGKIEKRLETMTANDNHNFEPSVQLVAGVGFEPTTFRL